MITTKKNLTFQQLQRVPLTKPTDAGEAWQGIRHAELLRALHTACADRGWETSLLAAALSPDKADMAVTVKVTNSGGEFRLGLLSSNARRFAPTLFLGGAEAQPVPFDYVVASVFIGRQRHADLRPKLVQALGEVDDLMTVGLASITSRLPRKEFTLNESNALYLEAARRKILPWSHLRYVEMALQNFADPKNAWSFFGAINRALNHATPMSQLHKRLALFELFQEKCGGGK